MLAAVQQQVEGIMVAERAHPESVSTIDRAMVGMLYALLAEARQLNRLTRWLIVVTIAVLTEAVVEFVLFYWLR